MLNQPIPDTSDEILAIVENQAKLNIDEANKKKMQKEVDAERTAILDRVELLREEVSRIRGRKEYIDVKDIMYLVGYFQKEFEVDFDEAFEIVSHNASCLAEAQAKGMWTSNEPFLWGLFPEAPKKKKKAVPKKKAEAPSTVIKGCRDMTKCLPNGTRIRTNTPMCSQQTGIYNSFADLAQRRVSYRKVIKFEGEMYSLNQFNLLPRKRERPEISPTGDAWLECECRLNGVWVSMSNLPELRV